ncbi:hypothetical protein B0H13DRAFT_1875113 [Mycena leptocephala]|nr:hypothetical protein B0H13DRAFT_1875113 [Mycena leptocephala]
MTAVHSTSRDEVFSPFLRHFDFFSVPWLRVDRRNRNTVRGMDEIADSELSAMADLRISIGSDSLVVHLEKIYQYYDAGHPDALFRVSRQLDEERASRLKQILQRYEVPFSERPLFSSSANKRICAAGKARIIRISEACHRLCANTDFEKFGGHYLAQAVTELKARCNQLEYLLRTGRSCPATRDRLISLVRNIKQSSALEDIEHLRDRGRPSESCVNWWKDELVRANRRVQEFDGLRKHYEDGGRRDLVVLMQENAKADLVEDVKSMRWGVPENGKAFTERDGYMVQRPSPMVPRRGRNAALMQHVWTQLADHHCANRPGHAAYARQKAAMYDRCAGDARGLVRLGGYDELLSPTANVIEFIERERATEKEYLSQWISV